MKPHFVQPPNMTRRRLGGLVIDIFDGKSGRRVWHGSAFELIRVGRVDRGRIRRAVERVLSTFPPQAAASR